MTNYIFVTGGVVSGIGKGIVAASVGNLLSRVGYSVSILKCDPYLNVDPGTMNPSEHGEVFVTHDGGETDLDLGHYERFLCKPLSKLSSITTGSVYNSILSKERAGKYDGKTVQIFHVTNEIKSRLFHLASYTNCDYLIVEIGGTVGDLESLPFLEAVRQVQTELPNNTLSIHCSYIPYLSCSGEYKTKPTQHSVKELRGLGISPDIIITRPEGKFSPSSILDKISTYCYVKRENVIDCPNLPNLYLVPDTLYKNGILDSIKSKFQFDKLYIDRIDSQWSKTLSDFNSEFSTTIAIIGKYMDQKDSYISVVEALKHASLHLNSSLSIKYIDSTQLFNIDNMKDVDGVVVPGGFGSRGIQSIFDYLKYCRTNNIPSLGICLGMQLMCTEFAKQYLDINCTTRELSNCTTSLNIIDYLPDQYDNINIGGTLRLGTYPTVLLPSSKVYDFYNNSPIVYERHRHRYEFNNQYRLPLEQGGLTFSGTSPSNQLVEIVELQSHPFYVGTQFHPEFSSNLLSPHPLFLSLIKSTL